MAILHAEDQRFYDHHGVDWWAVGSALIGGLSGKPVRGASTLSWAGIFNTFFWIDREQKVCAVLMTQMLPFLEDGPQALVNDFDRAVYAWRARAAP